MDDRIRTAVIGGGASGLTAAIFAAKAGAEVTVFEKQNRTGRKITASGNGRCNISNINIDSENYNGTNPSFVTDVFSQFNREDTEKFFYSIGIPFIEEKNGKIFPMSLEASAVAYLLELEAESLGVKILISQKIETILKSGNIFFLETGGKEKFQFDSVILAAGSSAFKPLGGSESGYTLASQAGHTILKPFPSILPLNIPLKSIHRLQGIKWNCGLNVRLNKKIIASSSGEVLFTAYGISGPATLEISRSVNQAVLIGEKPGIELDFFPDLPYEKLHQLLTSLLKKSNRTLRSALSGLIKNKIPEFIAQRAGLDRNTPSDSLNKKNIHSLAFCFKTLILEPGEPRSMAEAVAASGGVLTDEVNPLTMESKLLKGLFITGELLDIDGNSGGFNLQFAWSTGAIAGRSQLIKT